MDDVTIPLEPKLAQALEDIAARENRSREDVAAEALADYLREHQRATRAIQQGMADAREGRTTPHSAAMDRLRKAAKSA